MNCSLHLSHVKSGGIEQRALEEHREWIESNSIRQLSSYRSLVLSRWPQDNGDSHEGAESPPVVELRNRDSQLVGQNNKSLAVLEGFDTNAALILLEQEFKEVVSFSNPF
jgi:hypothetical protein